MILKNTISQFHKRIFRSYIKKTIIFSQLYQIRESYNNMLQNFTWINCWVLCVFGPWTGLGMRTSRFSRKLPKVASNYYLNYLLSFMCVFRNNTFDKDSKFCTSPTYDFISAGLSVWQGSGFLSTPRFNLNMCLKLKPAKLRYKVIVRCTYLPILLWSSWLMTTEKILFAPAFVVVLEV